MIGSTEGSSRAIGKSSSAAALIVGASLLAASCGPAQEAARSAPDTVRAQAGEAAMEPDTVPGDTTAADTAGTVPGAVDTAAPGTGAPARAADTLAPGDYRTVRADTVCADTTAGGADRQRWAPGGYMVYVLEGEIPDSVAIDHGVDSLRVVPELPGFYARLTSGQACRLARDRRVEQLAKEIEEGGRPMAEPRGIPVGGDTASGG